MLQHDSVTRQEICGGFISLKGERTSDDDDDDDKVSA